MPGKAYLPYHAIAHQRGIPPKISPSHFAGLATVCIFDNLEPIFAIVLNKVRGTF